MDQKELIDCLRTDAEWAKGQEWETPICLQDDLREAIAVISAAVEDIYHMGGCPNCKKNLGKSAITGLPMCAEHREYPNGECFEWRGPQKEE